MPDNESNSHNPGSYQTVRIGLGEFLVIGASPEISEAFKALIGERECPPGKDKDSYLRWCKSVLLEAADKAEATRQAGGVPHPIDWRLPKNKPAPDIDIRG